MSPRRIVFVIPNMTGGGAARVAAILVNEWVALGVETHLLTFEPEGCPSAYFVDERVHRHQVGFFASPDNWLGMVDNNWGRVRALRKCIKETSPHAVVSFLLEANLAAVVAGFGINIPVLVGERNHPAYAPISRSKRIIRDIIYPRSAKLCVQTHDIARWYSDHLGLDAEIIPNPVMPVGDDAVPASLDTGRTGEAHRLLAMGRLEPQKGLDTLVEAFAIAASDLPDWSLVIHGEGSERGELETRIARLGLVGRVVLPGATNMPIGKLLAADLFVHPARYEGYPNALIEALAAGRCVVATDCPGATREILANGRYGLLVRSEDVTGLACQLKRAMSDAELRRQFASSARDAVRHLAPGAVAQQWLDTIARLRYRV